MGVKQSWEAGLDEGQKTGEAMELGKAWDGC